MSPMTEAMVVFRIENMESYGNSIAFIDYPTPFEVEAQLCTPGESFTIDLECVECPAGFYLFKTYIEPHDCEEC